jgi:hypothetical protein
VTSPKPEREPVPIELVRPSFYAMLVLYYCGLTTYGATAVAFTSPSLVLVGGDTFAFWWATIVTAASAAAVLGVILSRRLQAGLIEFLCSILLISLLAGFSVALLVRGFTIAGAQGSIPIAWLPLILSVLPAWRLFVMALDGSVIFKRAKRRHLARASRYR